MCTSAIYAKELPRLHFPVLIEFKSVTVFSWGINYFPNFKFFPMTKRRTPLAALSRFPWKLFRWTKFSVSPVLSFKAKTHHAWTVAVNHLPDFHISLLKYMLHSNRYFSREPLSCGTSSGCILDCYNVCFFKSRVNIYLRNISP